MKKKEDDRIYHECMQLTSQVKFCPNAFRVDLYRGCDFGCKYCFSNMEAFNETGTGLVKYREAQLSDIQRQFELALETDKESKSTIVELLRHRVPIHCGGMADPFQSREWEYHLTKGLIEISNKYNYPITFSTKTAHLPSQYIDILNPDIHAFQISIMGLTDEYIRQWETNTPSAYDRINFVEYLRSLGFWCSVRIQPIIDIEECVELMNYLGNTPSYYSIEHLHVIADSYGARQALIKNCISKDDFCVEDAVFTFKHEVKKKNVLRLIELANSYDVKVGVADNDLHYLTQGRCCCGIDTIGDAFNNYLKFNECYFATGETDVSELFVPKSNCRRHFNIGAQKPTVFVEDVVKKYIKDNPNLIPDKYRESIEKQLFGISQRRLF